MKTKNNKLKLQKLTTAAVLSALSIVLMVTVRFPIFPATPFYEMEFADVPILICSWILGPVYALVSLLVVCVIQTLTVSSGSGIIGFLMHFLSSGLLIFVLSFFQKEINTVKGAKCILLRVASALVGVIAVILVMIPMNVWLTSEFMGLPPSEFFKAYLVYCVGFNAIKAGANVLIYNLLSPQLNKVYKKLFKI